MLLGNRRGRGHVLINVSEELRILNPKFTRFLISKFHDGCKPERGVLKSLHNDRPMALFNVVIYALYRSQQDHILRRWVV